MQNRLYKHLYPQILSEIFCIVAQYMHVNNRTQKYFINMKFALFQIYHANISNKGLGSFCLFYMKKCEHSIVHVPD